MTRLASSTPLTARQEHRGPASSSSRERLRAPRSPGLALALSTADPTDGGLAAGNAANALGSCSATLKEVNTPGTFYVVTNSDSSFCDMWKGNVLDHCTGFAVPGTSELDTLAGKSPDHPNLASSTDQNFHGALSAYGPISSTASSCASDQYSATVGHLMNDVGFHHGERFVYALAAAPVLVAGALAARMICRKMKAGRSASPAASASGDGAARREAGCPSRALIAANSAMTLATTLAGGAFGYSHVTHVMSGTHPFVGALLGAGAGYVVPPLVGYAAASSFREHAAAEFLPPLAVVPVGAVMLGALTVLMGAVAGGGSCDGGGDAAGCGSCWTAGDTCSPGTFDLCGWGFGNARPPSPETTVAEESGGDPRQPGTPRQTGTQGPRPPGTYPVAGTGDHVMTPSFVYVRRA